MRKQRQPPPAIVVGGGSNALSIARSLGERGVEVYALNDTRSLVRHSRFCRWIDSNVIGDLEAVGAEHLLGPELAHLQGAVLLAASDAALIMLTRCRAQLERRFVLDLSDSDAQLSMLDKLETYQLAQEARVATPLFWNVRSWADVLELRHELVFPLLVKPRLSHEFEARFSRKFFTANTMTELQTSFETAADSRIDVLLMELIPGPDSLLCSYYTYLDERGQPLFNFTKRVVRRHPVGMGTGCFHVTADVPVVRELALALFRQAGLRGVANAEFKMDPRTGALKLIECNARFTAANCLVRKAGLDLPYFVYARAVGLPLPSMSTFESGLTLWDPIEDFFAFLELNRSGNLSLREWIRCIVRRHTLPYFYWTDPMPSLIALSREVWGAFHSRRAPWRSLRRTRRVALGADCGSCKPGVGSLSQEGVARANGREEHYACVPASPPGVEFGRLALAKDVNPERGK